MLGVSAHRVAMYTVDTFDQIVLKYRIMLCKSYGFDANCAFIQPLRAFRRTDPFGNGRSLVVHHANKETKKCPDPNTSENAINGFVVLKQATCATFVLKNRRDASHLLISKR